MSKVIFSTAIALVALFAFAVPARALTISPARVEISGDPGAQVGGEFTLINEQSTAQTFYVSYENFSAQGETGAPAFSSEKTGLDTWITVPQSSITIAPGQIQQVPYTISIPAGTEPGGYFSVLFLSTTPPSAGGGQVSIGAKIGMLLLLRVNGNVAESAGISQFDKNGHGFFYKTLPVTLRYKFHNGGGDRVEPTGHVTIRDTVFLPAAHLDANSETGNILPGSTRQFIVTWIKDVYAVPPQGFFANAQYEWHNFAIGLYSAHVDLSYGTKGLHATNTTWFFVLPWELAIILLVVIVIVWWGGKTLLRRYNRYIIRQARLMSNHDSDRS